MHKLFTLVFVMREGQVLLGMKKRGFGAGKFNGFGGTLRQVRAWDWDSPPRVAPACACYDRCVSVCVRVCARVCVRVCVRACVRVRGCLNVGKVEPSDVSIASGAGMLFGAITASQARDPGNPSPPSRSLAVHLHRSYTQYVCMCVCVWCARVLRACCSKRAKRRSGNRRHRFERSWTPHVSGWRPGCGWRRCWLWVWWLLWESSWEGTTTCA
jgi:hypothetical protein